MEKNIQMSTFDNFATASDNMVSSAKNFIMKPFLAMKAYYSSVIGKEVSSHQAWLLTEVQLAFMAVIMPIDMYLLLRAIAVAWFISAAIRTKGSFE